ncbi:hypothetical protein ACFL6C_03205 [Myxococcota bacterium]
MQLGGSEAARISGTEDCLPGEIDQEDAHLASVAQLVLAEKRTSLAVLRTGVAAGLVPLSVTTVLVTVSRLYHWLDNLHFLIPMYLMLSCLTVVSLYLIGRALFRIRHHDKMLDRLRRASRSLQPFLD